MVDLLLGLVSFHFQRPRLKRGIGTGDRHIACPHSIRSSFLDSTQRPQLKIKLLAQRSILLARREKALKQAHDDLVNTGALALCPRTEKDPGLGSDVQEHRPTEAQVCLPRLDQLDILWINVFHRKKHDTRQVALREGNLPYIHFEICWES